MKLLSNYDLAVKVLGEAIVQKEYWEQLYNFREREASKYSKEKEILKEENASLRIKIQKVQEIFRTTKEIPREFIDEVLKWE